MYVGEMEFCAGCGHPVPMAAIESAHHTSEGLVRYRRCDCGRRWVETLAFAGPGPWPARAVSRGGAPAPGG